MITQHPLPFHQRALEAPEDAGGTRVAVSRRSEQPRYLTEFSKALLDGFYLDPDETLNERLARVAEAFCMGDYDLAQRIYEAAHNGWFMFASPVLSNAPKGAWSGQPNRADWSYEQTLGMWQGDRPRAMPISCFALFVGDSIDSQISSYAEMAELSISGGGVGLHNGIRAVSDKAPGPIPYMKTIDAAIGYFKQSKVRRGSCAWYMDIDHPDIIEHIRFRIPSGGDSARKSDNRTQFHCAINITDEFINAVLLDLPFDLRCPHTGEVRETLRARVLWEEILEARALTGEPYLLKIDTANRALPQSQKDKGLKIRGSNICSEIVLPTNEERTFVCCLSSLNLETYEEWKDTTIVADLVRFLDNVLQFFIEQADARLARSVLSARMERALGLGTMGWHHYLMSKGIPFEGGGVGSAIHETHKIFASIKAQAVAESQRLAGERGEPADMVGTGLRNSHLMALAPNSNNAIVAGTSPSIEPVSGIAYSHATRAGTHLVKNPYFERVLNTLALDRDNPEQWIQAQWQSIVAAEGSVQHLDYLSPQQKAVFKTAFEMDQHWLVEQADARQQYVCQAQSLNLFFPAGVSRAYFNSVHLKALTAEHVKTVYYARMSRGVSADVARSVEQTVTEWTTSECRACEG